MSTRHEKLVALTRRLHEDIAAVCPPELGPRIDDQTWDHIAELSDLLLDLLLEWEWTGEPALIDVIRPAYDAVVDAWRHAAAEYRGDVQQLEAVL